MDYALDIGVKILTYFEDYFNIPYPLPKQGKFINQYSSIESVELPEPISLSVKFFSDINQFHSISSPPSYNLKKL